MRAWRGDNLLLAPELRGDKEADQLTATGGVKTLWYPSEDQAASARAQSAPKPAAPRRSPPPRPIPQHARTPVQVLASEMTYQQKAGILIYTGNVRVDQEGKTLTCQRLEVDLDAGATRRRP